MSLTPSPTTWRECADAGMSLTAAARLLGKTVSTGSVYAKRHGFKFAADYSANAARMKALNADPEFAAKARARSSARMKALHADPEFNPLAALNPSERADYDVLVKSGGYSRCDALVAIGRSDLVKP